MVKSAHVLIWFAAICICLKRSTEAKRDPRLPCHLEWVTFSEGNFLPQKAVAVTGKQLIFITIVRNVFKNTNHFFSACD